MFIVKCTITTFCKEIEKYEIFYKCFNKWNIVTDECHDYYLKTRPRGLMDKASDFGSEDCEFESRRGRTWKFLFSFILGLNTPHKCLFFVPIKCLTSLTFIARDQCFLEYKWPYLSPFNSDQSLHNYVE